MMRSERVQIRCARIDVRVLPGKNCPSSGYTALFEIHGGWASSTWALGEDNQASMVVYTTSVTSYVLIRCPDGVVHATKRLGDGVRGDLELTFDLEDCD